MKLIRKAAAGTGATSSRLSTLEALRAAAPGHKARESSRSKDKFANYSSAKDLGFEDEETEKTSYEIEQELKGRAGEVGGWETVEAEPTGLYTPPVPAEAESSTAGAKRKLGEYTTVKNEQDDNHEGWRIRQKKDPYDEEEWDPRAAIKGKVKQETRSGSERKPAEIKKEEGRALDREVWTGRLELNPVNPAGREREGLVYVEGGGWVKPESGGAAGEASQPEANLVDTEKDVKPDVPDTNTEGIKREPIPAKTDEALSDVKPEVEGSSSLFKKRRPPPSSRKK